MKRYVNVVVLTNTGNTDQLYTYALDSSRNNLEGIRVELPFGKGNRKQIGIVIEEISEIPNYSVKNIDKILDSTALITPELMTIAKKISKDTLCNYTQALKAVIPGGIQLQPNSKKVIHVQTANYIRRNDGFDITTLSSKAKKQHYVLNYLKNLDWVSEKELLADTGVSRSVIQELWNKNAIQKDNKRVFRNVISPQLKYKKLRLNEEQYNAYQSVVNHKGKGIFLLKGVTGSGKTEVYLQLVENTLKNGKSAIILVPEIALTPQTIARFSGRFGERVAVLHSKLTYSERYDQWQKILDKDVDIVVGARSAIFAPLKNLGIIIIDEEHEESYKSDQTPKYDAREIGEIRANYHQIPLVLGSATPRLESCFRVYQKDIILLELNRRALNQNMPDLSIVDMRTELKEKNNSIFSRLLYYEIQKALRQKKQIILFLNKRGHSSFVFCRKCGYSEKCDSCEVSMTYHQHAHRLICHYCGKTKMIPNKCPVCGSSAIRHFGIGTEQVEEYVRKYFKNARVARMDFDTTRQKNSYVTIYKKMIDGDIDILIGTQMIAKGLDFKNVTLVGVLSADISLNLPNYKASEKTFQLITQVAGRAGRGEEPGKVIVQTYNPEHYAIAFSKNYDYHSFYQEEMKVRKIFQYPPYTELISVICSGRVRKKVGWTIHYLYSTIKDLVKEKEDKIWIIGPNPCQIPKIKDNYRFQILIKTSGEIEFIKSVLRRISTNNEFKIDKKEVKIGITIHPGMIL